MRTRKITKKKMLYVMTEALSDLGLKKVYTIEFQITLFIIMMTCWFRMYLHFFGEYLALLAMSIPVTKFDPYWHAVHIEYAPWRVLHDVTVVLAGTLINTFLFLVMMLTSYISVKYLKRFPAILSKIIAWYGISTMFDFVLVFAVDYAIGNDENGDMWKLYNYYLKRDDRGTVGIVL